MAASHSGLTMYWLHQEKENPGLGDSCILNMSNGCCNIIRRYNYIITIQDQLALLCFFVVFFKLRNTKMKRLLFFSIYKRIFFICVQTVCTDQKPTCRMKPVSFSCIASSRADCNSCFQSIISIHNVHRCILIQLEDITVAVYMSPCYQ